MQIRPIIFASIIIIVSIVALALFQGLVSSTTLTTNNSCTLKYPNGATGGSIEFPSINSTALMCVRYYYYNLNSTLTVNTSFLQVIYFNQSTGTSEINQNFSIAVSPNSITIGGPNNENEGVEVSYSITPNSGANGTFEGHINAPLFWMSSGHSEAMPCAYQFTIVVGNGVADNVIPFNSCLTASTVSINSTPQLWVEVVGLTNGTSNTAH